jgi:tetratricopeptide (TPR) repeat protein
MHKSTSIIASLLCAMIVSSCRDNRINAANALLESGDFLSARLLYSRIVEAKPKNFAAQYGLGMTFCAEAMDRTELGLATPEDWYDAINHLTVASRLDTGREARRMLAIFHYNLGTCYKKTGNISDAILRIGQAIAYDSTLLKGYNMLGALYHEQGDFEKAESCYRRALILKPDYAMAHFNLGALFLAKKEPEKALEYFTDATAIEPDNDLFRSWLLKTQALTSRH